jgi:hypothetical protein
VNICLGLRYKRKIIPNQPTFEQKVLKKVPSLGEQIQLAIEALTEGKRHNL